MIKSGLMKKAKEKTVGQNRQRRRLRAAKITAKAFAPYGWVIDYPGRRVAQKASLFDIVLKETKPYGWRIAYLVLRDKSVRQLEQHPDSYESFEPVKGRSLIYVAKAQDPAKIKCFKLDRPVILKKGLWHTVVTLTPESEIKITENAEVECVYWKLGFEIKG